jgi:hypothetical protein
MKLLIMQNLLLFTTYYQDEQIKEDEMDGECEFKNVSKFWSGNLNGRET